MHVRPPRILLPLVLGLGLGLGACTPATVPDPPADPATRVVGGADSLPGPLPAGVTFASTTEGVDAPATDLHLVDGTTVSLGDYEDRPVVLVFFGTWCQWCTDHQPALNELAEKHAGSVLFLGVTGTDTDEEASAYAAEQGLPYPVALDPDLTVHRAFAVDEPPLVAVVAPGGRLVRGWPGGVELDTLADTLDSFSAGQG